MNTDRIRQLADHLRTLPEENFDLAHWFNGLRPSEAVDPVMPACRTCACIAGEALFLFEPNIPVHLHEVQDVASVILDINGYDASCLFQPLPYRQFGDRENYQLPRGRTIDSITAAEATTVLDHLANTGEVDWRVLK